MTIPTIETPTREHQALSLFFEKIKTMGFMARLFHWKPFLTLSFEAYAQYQSLSKVRQAQQKANWTTRTNAYAWSKNTPWPSSLKP